jgi:hypothetical protein
MNDSVSQSVQTMHGALGDMLPSEMAAEVFREVFPLDEIVEAFREGLALFFSPFTGFWYGVRSVIRQR